MDDEILRSFTSRYSDSIAENLDELRDNFLITDPSIAGHPIVFASSGFLSMSGYSREEVIGRNGRMFQGPETDTRSVIEIREAIREERAVQVSLLNYRKDGTPMWILFHLFPVFDKADGCVSNFVAVQVPIAWRRRRRRVVEGDRRRCSWEGGGVGGIVFGSCRREMFADTEIGCKILAADSFIDSDDKGFKAEQLCEASEVEKQMAIVAAKNILSALTYCSELTGRMVSGKRCNSFRVAPLNSSLIISLGRIKQSFVLVDPCLPDMPIVYASDAFLRLTGYSRSEVLGRNCRFLNGSDTDALTITEIKENIQAERSCSVRILNYRKDGSSFWNLLHMSPARNATGKAAFFVAVQIEESSKNDGQPLSPEMRQLGVVGAVKVAVRSLSLSTAAGCSKS